MSVILYARVSKLTHNENTFCLSLNSQEHEIINFMRIRNLTLFKVLKDIGSAFSGNQKDFKNLIKSYKNKIILVYEPSRLTRNLKNFDDNFLYNHFIEYGQYEYRKYMKDNDISVYPKYIIDKLVLIDLLKFF